jgi:putative ABC transport system substrate-binding protein
MREFGYLEGRDYSIADRYADGDPRRLPLLAEELVRLRPDVIVATSVPTAQAVRQATGSIPIVVTALVDPVGSGLIVSEARPGTNVTGILARIDGLPGKQIEIARDFMPGLSKIGLLGPATENVAQRQEVEQAAAKLAVNLALVEIRNASDVGAAFQTFERERVNFVAAMAHPIVFGARREIASFALAARLPTVHNFREHVEDGGLISYGVNLRENYRRLAYYVNRLLKGEKPADLPVEFPTKLEMVVNAATARALGLTIPPSIMLRVDEVIE